MSRFVFAVTALLFAFGVLAQCHTPPSPPKLLPSQKSPPPPLPACSITLTVTRMTGGFKSTSCPGMIDAVNNDYGIILPWQCTSPLSGNGTALHITAESWQTNVMAAFYASFMDMTPAGSLYSKYNLGSGDSVSIASTCSGLAPASFSAASSPPPPPPPKSCNFALNMHRSSGGLTSAICTSLGSTLRLVYKTNFRFVCTGSNTTDVFLSTFNAFNSQMLVDSLRKSLMSDYAKALQVGAVYTLNCATDYIELTGDCTQPAKMRPCNAPPPNPPPKRNPPKKYPPPKRAPPPPPPQPW